MNGVFEALVFGTLGGLIVTVVITVILTIKNRRARRS